MYSCLNYATTIPLMETTTILFQQHAAMHSSSTGLSIASFGASTFCTFHLLQMLGRNSSLLLYHLLRTLFSTSKSCAGKALAVHSDLKAAHQPPMVGFRQEILFHVLSDLGLVGRERKHRNCRNRAHTNFDIRRRRTK